MSNEKFRNRIEFNYYPDDRSCERQVNLSFEVDNDMHVAEFHRFCRAFGIVLGYTPQTIDKYFGKKATMTYGN